VMCTRPLRASKILRETPGEGREGRGKGRHMKTGRVGEI
jgi:hypothetical protein